MKIIIKHENARNSTILNVENTDSIISVIAKIYIKINLAVSNRYELMLRFENKILDETKKLVDYNIHENCTLYLLIIYKGGGPSFIKEINIKFIKNQRKKYNFDIFNNYYFDYFDTSIFFQKYKSEEELYGLLKLCFLKEISLRINKYKIKELPEFISYIFEILKNGYIQEENPKKDIKNILQKIEGSNILNFSKFVDKTINSNHINQILNYLHNKEIKYIKNSLLKYNEYIKLFEKDFEVRKRNSIFEFSIISMVIMEREDFKTFKNQRKYCENRIDKILYHGTSIEPISCILTGYFKKSIERCYQHGKGVYFSDILDYIWFYGGEKNNRCNTNKIPKVNETFSLIACSTYFNKYGFRKVKDYKYTPKKNEINFAYANYDLSTIEDEPDKSKFYGTEYVIWDLNQICPFIGAKLKRNEYCVIWRDINFSLKPVYNNEFDEIFKNFLKERLIYIEQYAEFNIYPFESSEKALKLIKRKKYNKIILISNIGTDLGGKKFIDEARKIIGNEVIALFLAYNKNHLDWIKDYKNALFSNEPNFYEDYLKCFSDDGIKKELKILILKEKIEKKYNIKLNFNDKYLYFPNYKSEGNYSDLTF